MIILSGSSEVSFSFPLTVVSRSAHSLQLQLTLKAANKILLSSNDANIFPSCLKIEA